MGVTIVGGKSLSPVPGGLWNFRTFFFKIRLLNFLKGWGNESSCHLLISISLALTSVCLFNNSSSSGTSWSPWPIRVLFPSFPLSASSPAARFYLRPLKAPPMPREPAVPAPNCSMESFRGRPGAEADLLPLGGQQAGIFGCRPGGAPSEPPSGFRVSGEEEAENVGGSSRHPRASPKTLSCSVVQEPEPEAPENDPGRAVMPCAPGSRRGAPGP